MTITAQVTVLSPALAVMVVLPTLMALTIPFSTVATDGFDEVQVTVLSVASDGLTVAVKVTDCPTFNDAVVLSRVMLITGVASTVTEQVAILSPTLAVMVVLPTLMALTFPFSTVATDGFDEVQVTVLSVASDGLTVAASFIDCPARSDAVVLSRVMLVTGVASTVTAQVAVLSPALAVMVVLPTLIAFTMPFSTVATDGFDEVQVTVLSVASDGLTVAASFIDCPALSDAVVLSRVMLVTGVASTVTVQVAVLSPALAVMVELPTLIALTVPFSTVATDGFDELHVTVLSVASVGLTVTVNVILCPAFNEAVVLSNVIDWTSIGFTLIIHVAYFSPHVALISASPIFSAETNPSSIFTTDLSDEDHTIVLFVVFSGKTFADRRSVCPIWISTSVLSRVTFEANISANSFLHDTKHINIKMMPIK